MADSVYIFTGMDYTTNLLELALSTDDLVLIVPGSEMGAPPHDNTWHTSKWAHGEKLTRYRVSNRTWPIKLLAGDTDSESQADDLGDALISLELLVKQARRSHTDGDVDKVGLYFKLDGASNPTYYTIIDMECNGMSLMEEISRIRRDAQATFTLITEPFGYGDEETIENWLLTPHMQEDGITAGPADGLADNWTETGAPVTTLDTDIYICGSQSQKVVTDDSGTDGIESDTVACTDNQGDDFVSYAWVYVASGDEVTLDIENNGGSSLGTDTYSAATVTGAGNSGNTWKRLEVIGAIGGADTTVQAKVERLTGDASAATTFYVDKCYLQFGVDVIPTAWCSQNKVWQHSDDNSLLDGTVNYLDVDDVPGDAEAETEFGLYGNNATIGYVYIGRRSSGEAQASCGFRQQLTAVGDTNYSADAARINGGVWTDTPTSSWAAVSDWFHITEPLVNAIAPKYRVLVSVNDANGDDAVDAERSDWRLAYYLGSDTAYTESVKFSQHDASTRWTWTDIGVVDFSRHDLRSRVSSMLSTDRIASFSLYCKRDTGSHAVSCDAIMFIPVENDAFSIFSTGGTVTTGYWYFGDIDTDDSYLNWSSAWQYDLAQQIGGSVPKLYPGSFHRFNTLICTLVISGSYYQDISAPDNYCKIQLRYRPQTKYLFGS